VQETAGVELQDAIRRRRMVRAFERGRDVAPDVVDRVLDAGRRAPSAGKTQALELLVLTDDVDRARFWDVSFPDADARAAFGWQGLFDAPVLVVPVVEAGAYARRYAEPDKAASRLGDVHGDVDAWPVPYWWVDGGMAVQSMLLVAVDEGLGAVFFGLFDREVATLQAFGVPADRRALGVVALGHPAPSEPGRSERRIRRSLGEIAHRGTW
jgi:nitroreductase